MYKGFSALILAFLIVLTGVLIGSVQAQAADLSSAHFIVRDPVLGSGGSFETSSNFQLFGNGEFVFTGRTPSSGSFLGHFGFLYFPFVTTPTLSGIAEDSAVDLSWTTSNAGLGFSVSGYEYGVATSSGGPYTFFNVGNVASTTAPGLTNDTAYYFVVRTLDAHGDPIITSNEISVTPTSGTTPPPPPGNGGSGKFMGVRFIGYAYPNAVVSFLKDAVQRATTTADANGAFTVLLQEEYDQNVLYTLYADDPDGTRSLLLNYPLIGKESTTSEISGIKFAPTEMADKIAVKLGDAIAIKGFALPNTQIEFVLSASTAGGAPRTFTATSAVSGRYELDLSTADLAKGEYEVRGHYPGDTRYGLTIQFGVGDTNIAPAAPSANLPGDCNADHAITLKDFSILAYWYNKAHPPSCIDVNHDGVINLVDFSILAYYWNG